MFFFTFVATPKQDNPRRYEYGGAFVNCWVNLADGTEAERIARTTIDRCGWRIEARETACVVTPDHCKGREERKHFQQAEHDGHCLIFETWSMDSEDEE
jgi:hypothetical protein